MSDLPVCRICGMHPVFVAENVLFHEHNPDKPCPLTTDHFSVAQWNALMDVPGGEAVGFGLLSRSTRQWDGETFVSIADADGYDKAALLPLYTHPAPAIWNSPDITPNVKRGGSGFFVVAVRRSNGKIYTFPAAYLNKMELSFEDCSVPESGYGCVFEETEDGAICSGWFDWKTHADYDDFYQVLLEDGEELVAWACLPVFGGQVAQQSPAPAVDGAVLLEADIKAHMAGQADAGVDPSYSNAQQYAYKAMKGEG